MDLCVDFGIQLLLDETDETTELTIELDSVMQRFIFLLWKTLNRFHEYRLWIPAELSVCRLCYHHCILYSCRVETPKAISLIRSGKCHFPEFILVQEERLRPCQQKMRTISLDFTFDDLDQAANQKRKANHNLSQDVYNMEIDTEYHSKKYYVSQHSPIVKISQRIKIKRRWISV
ncbi:uncharacterized protein LOC112493832 [Cephus cinctus]|uniref:Uncharacterized protein LOC112493832 n=1 Tax=Cephus cinctus TaxID=211228 RepID=A0AAJ7RAI8_CEPCN|nr:uncharacterized protein LOC112493832 [Cephus cinctus]